MRRWQKREKRKRLAGRKAVAGALALICVLGAAGLTGCNGYASSQEIRESVQAIGAENSGDAAAGEPGVAGQNGGAAAGESGVAGQNGVAAAGEPGAAGQNGVAAAGGPGAAGGNGGAAADESGLVGQSGGAAADTIQLETDLTRAPGISFEETADDIYVKSSGGSVRIRSACDTGDDANIITYASAGTQLKRTGKNSQWTRIDYNGRTAYIATDYIAEQAPAGQEGQETAAAAGNAGVDESAGAAAGPGASGGNNQSAGAGTASGASTEASTRQISMDSSWKYAEFSKINSGSATLYRSGSASRKNITVAVNAGHGTKGGTSVKTQCHPDGTPKVTGGTTSAGAISAVAVSGGMTFSDGTAESTVTLSMAKILKDQLLTAGYDVLMIRDGEDVQLDNVARSVIANNASDCHIALHWDSTTSNKGAFYMSVPNVESYRNMEPVKSHWQQHNALGESLVGGLKEAGVKIFSGGSMAMDLTQTSYSTVPSVDIELGDKASDHSQATLQVLAQGLVKGINSYFGQ